MEALQNRINSFAKTKTKRVKTGQKSRTVTLKWPHPQTFLANPAALAEAGFYYSPSLEDQDNVTCFECGKQLSEWEEQDDPFDVHWSKCANQCSWATVRCGLRADLDRHKRFTFPDKSRLPGTNKMEKARLGTFTTGDGWIHDQVKNHGASSSKMAQAGFVWTPQHPGDDLATCFYCNIALSGWENDDDPMEEHRKRGKPGETCPFLAYTGSASKKSTIITNSNTAESEHPAKLTWSTSTKPPSRSQSKTAVPLQSRASKPSRARAASSRRTKGTTEDGDNEALQRQGAISEDEDDISPAPSQLTCSASVKPLSRSQSKTAAAPSKSRASKTSKSRFASSRRKKHDTANVAAPSTTRRKTRKIVDEEVTDIFNDEDEQLPSQPASEREDESEPRARSTRATSIKSSSKMLSKIEVPVQSFPASKSTKNEVAARRKTRRVVDEEVMDIFNDEDEQLPSQPASEREDEMEPRTRPTRSTSIKPTYKILSKTEVPLPSSRTSKSMKKEVAMTSTRRKTRQVVDEEVMDIENDAQPLDQPASEEEDELDSRPQRTRLASNKSTSKSLSKTGALLQSPRAPKSTKKEVAMTSTRRKTRKVIDEAMDIENDAQPLDQPASEEEDESDSRPQRTRLTSNKSTSKSSSKTEALSQSLRAPKSTKKEVAMTSMRRKTCKVIDEEAMDIENDAQPLDQPASEEEDELDSRLQLTQSTSKKFTSKSLPKTEALSHSSQTSRSTKKAVADTRRRTRQVIDEDIVGDEDVQPHNQPVSEEENELDSQTQLTQMKSMEPPSRNSSKNEAAPPRSRTPRAQNKTRHKTQNVADEDIAGDEDTQPTTQPASEIEIQPLSGHESEQENTTQPISDQLRQSAFVKQSSSALSRIKATILQPRVSETATTAGPPSPSANPSKTHAGLLDDAHSGQGSDEEKKPSFLQKTPPPTELFSSNSGSSPKQDPTMAVAAPQLTLPAPEVSFSAKGDNISSTVIGEVAPKLKTPETQILPPLSRIPIMPLQTLTDAELDMTVEEWIRYQMEVEFDKLKRDGEREMARFKAQTEEVRKMIEGL